MGKKLALEVEFHAARFGLAFMIVRGGERSMVAVVGPCWVRLRWGW